LLRTLGLIFRSKFGKAWAMNFTFLFAARLTLRGALGKDHDPTKGWTSYDNRQMFFDAVIGAAAAGFLSPVPFTRMTGLTRFAWVSRNERIIEPVIESPLIGFASSGIFAMFNQAFILHTPATQGWGAYWKNVGVAAGFGAAGGLGAGLFRAGMAARWAGIANEDEGVGLTYWQNAAVNFGLRTAPQDGLTGMAAWTARYGSLMVNPVSRAIITTGEITVPGVREARGVNVAPFPPDTPVAITRPGLGSVPVGSPPSATVRAGDTLWDIARRQYGSGLFAGDIARRNHLANPDLIHPGQHLVLPPVDRAHAHPLPVHHHRHLAPVARPRHRPLLLKAAGRSHHA
jgi:LysM domain